MKIVLKPLSIAIFLILTLNIVTGYADDNFSDIIIDNSSEPKNSVDNLTIERPKMRVSKHDAVEERYNIKLSLSAEALGIIDLINGGGKVVQNFTLIPYLNLHIRLYNGGAFLPEVKISESGIFNFDKVGIRLKSEQMGYNNYYIKVPTPITIPFFTYDSPLNIDFRYSTTTTSFKVSSPIIADGHNISSGYIALTGSVLEGRIFLDSPIVLGSTFFNNSYFGLYYTELSDIKVTTPPKAGSADYLISTTTRGGGIFYDINTDTPLKGLDFNIALRLGYGNTNINDRYKISIGNIYHLLLFTINAGVSYRYSFTEYFTMMVKAGISYVSINSFFSTAITDRYSVALGGNLMYNFGLSFIY